MTPETTSKSLIDIPKLYALGKNGKIRVFMIKVTSAGDGRFMISSKTGELKGKPTVVDKIITKGKNIGKSNETTPEDQAKVEAMSAFREKLNDGYKTLNDLSLKAISLEIDLEPSDLDNKSEFDLIEALFNSLHITYNTDQYWRKLPMLAEKWKDYKTKVNYPVIVQPKLNGVRCLASYDADLQQVVLSSRGGAVFNVPYLQHQLEPFFLLNQNLYLDGELYVHGKPLQEISGAARKEKDQPDWLQFHLYDCIIDKPQIDRVNDLRIFVEILRTQYNADKIFLVENHTALSEADVKVLHDKYVADGHEGAIVRSPLAKYQISFRDKCLLKVKEFLDEEFELIDCEVKENRGMESFIFILKNNKDDQTFGARPTGTVEQKEMWYKNPESWVGKKATIRFQERSTGGLPIQGHVRHQDTTPLMECIRDYEG